MKYKNLKTPYKRSQKEYLRYYQKICRKLKICENCKELKPYHGKELCKDCYDKKYNKEHPEKVKQWHGKSTKKWVQKNREWANLLWRNYKIRRKGATGSHTLKEWEILKAQYNWTCPICKKREPNIKLTEDHIIPLSKGGSNNIENIQPLCRSCNSSKGAK